jgi:serine/threonine protein kinase
MTFTLSAIRDSHSIGAPRQPPIDRKFLDRTSRLLLQRGWRLEQRLESVGGKRVYRARSIEEGAKGAVKVLTGNDAAEHEKFWREVYIADDLSEIADLTGKIPRPLLSVREDDLSIVVNEWVEGGSWSSLQSLLENGRGVMHCDIAAQTAEIIAALHRQGVTLGGPRPERVFLQPTAAFSRTGKSHAPPARLVSLSGAFRVDRLSREAHERALAVDIAGLGFCLARALLKARPFALDNPLELANHWQAARQLLLISAAPLSTIDLISNCVAAHPDLRLAAMAEPELPASRAMLAETPPSDMLEIVRVLRRRIDQR